MNHDLIFGDMFSVAKIVEKVGNARVVASIFDKKGNFVSEGYNRMKTHPFQKRWGTENENIFLHAEIDAIISAIRAGRYVIDEFKECSIFVCRAKQNMKKTKWMTGLALPCKGCQRALAHFGFKNVYYTENDKTGFECL